MNFFPEDSAPHRTSQSSGSSVVKALENFADNMIRDVYRDDPEALKFSAPSPNTNELVNMFGVGSWYLLPSNYFKITLYDIILVVLKPTVRAATKFGMFSPGILLLEPLPQTFFFL